MTKNPILNALAAVLYITLVAAVMFYGGRMGGPDNSIIAPIAILSLFTLSAAVMGYLFLGEPIQLYLNGKRKEAVNLFLQTVGVFSIVTIIALAILFSGVLNA